MDLNEIYSYLCYYDMRNPYGALDLEMVSDHAELLKTKKQSCFCDNCFYGRTKLALEI